MVALKRLIIFVSIPLIVGIGGGEVMALELRSSIFKHKEFIPVKYSCQGEDVSPELNWSDVPSGAQSLALICDDPDAPIGTWVHWVIYNIPVNKGGLSESIDPKEELVDGIKQGRNDFGKIGYGGPCPPPGGPHRYFFKLYCLDTALDLESGLRKKELLKVIERHIIEETHLIGLYKR